MATIEPRTSATGTIYRVKQRKHAPPPFLTVVANTADEAEDRSRNFISWHSQPAAEPSGLTGSDRQWPYVTRCPPSFQIHRRKVRGRSRKPHTPRREKRAVTTLRDIWAARDDAVTKENATRVIEQARVIIDRTRGISTGDRKVIEAAREIVALSLVMSDRTD
jgi:hypothetical protein